MGCDEIIRGAPVLPPTPAGLVPCCSFMGPEEAGLTPRTQSLPTAADEPAHQTVKCKEGEGERSFEVYKKA